MPTIAVLPQHLVNRIAAGEVVERPASVVKELLENSLDAGATQVTVEIEDGGKKLIRISDDGCGMDAENLPLAVAPHATSKISCDDDLFAIGTLGFRGEALASIASISQLEILSRPGEQIEGARLTISAGELDGPVPAPAAPGTTITIRNLFHNTPARRRFLRTAATELGHITERFTRIALAHTHVQMTLVNNGRTVHQLPADQSLRERIGVLFSPELAADLLPISRRDPDGEITGLIAPPITSRTGSQWQYIFLNSRYIRDRFIGHAIREAYRGMIDSNRQPVVFIFITIPPDAVDVNVHPAKTEVRFADSNRMHSQVLAALRDRLLSSDLSTPLHDKTLQQDDGPRGSTAGAEPDEQRRERVRQAMADFFKSSGQAASANSHPRSTMAPGVSRGGGTGYGASVESDNRPGNAVTGNPEIATGSPAASSRPTCPNDAAAVAIHPVQPTREQAAAFGTLPATSPGHQTGASATPAATPPEDHTSSSLTRFLQIHNTYLVAETDEGLMIVDQHALHERIIYEQLNRRLHGGPLPCQRCLIPETIDVTGAQIAALEEAAPLLKELGVMLEQFGPTTVAVQGFPAMIERASPVAFVADLLDLFVSQANKVTREELLHHVLDMIACKAAVKAGDPLSDAEIKNLLDQRYLVDRAGSCPHGRPTTITLTRAQLEKQFKRT